MTGIEQYACEVSYPTTNLERLYLNKNSYESIARNQAYGNIKRKLEEKFDRDTLANIRVNPNIEYCTNNIVSTCKYILDVSIPTVSASTATTATEIAYHNNESAIRDMYYRRIGTPSSYTVGIDYGNETCCSTATTVTYDRDSITWERLDDFDGCRWERRQVQPSRSPGDRLRDIMQSRQAPMLIVPRRQKILTKADVREERARETLRRILGQDRFRRFLRDGFISLKAESGKFYQLFTGKRV